MAIAIAAPAALVALGYFAGRGMIAVASDTIAAKDALVLRRDREVLRLLSKHKTPEEALKQTRTPEWLVQHSLRDAPFIVATRRRLQELADEAPARQYEAGERPWDATVTRVTEDLREMLREEREKYHQ